MMFFIILLVVFILLILISIANALIFLALKLVTKEYYKEQYLIVPSFISLLLWSVSYIIAMKLISSITGMSIFDSISASLFNTSNFMNFIPVITIPLVVLLIITLFFQSFALLTVNIDYAAPFNKFRYFIKKKAIIATNKKIRNDEYSEAICLEVNTDIKQIEEKYKLDFVNSFVCSLFIFSLLFFLIIIFFWIGTLIADKIIVNQ